MKFSDIVRRELMIIALKRNIFIFAVFAPILLSSVMAAIFWKGVMFGVPVAVMDADNSSLSREFTEMLRASPYLDLVYNINSQSEGVKLIQQGKINGFVSIPEGFARSVLSGGQAVAGARYNNQFLTQGGTVNKALTEAALTFAAKYDAVRFMSQGVPIWEVSGMIMPVNTVNHILYNPSLDYSWFLLLGVLPVMWQLAGIGFTVYMMGVGINEADSCVAETVRLCRFKFILAKLTPYAAMFCVQFIFILFILFAVLKVPMNGSFAAIATGSLLFITGTMSVGLLIISVVKKLNISLSAASVYVTPAFAYAGVTFPHEAMPLAAKIWSNLLPITHYHKLLVNSAIRGAPDGVVLQTLGVLSLFTVLVLPVALLIYGWRLNAK